MNCRTFVTKLAATALWLPYFFAQTPARAQGVGTILGTITDPSGAVVPEAKVKVTNQGTRSMRETQSNGQGYFVIPALPAATYSVSVEAPGFVTSVQEGLVLLVDQSATVNIALALARASQEVTVEAASTQVNTANATLSQVVEQKRMVDLPLNGRNAATLALLVPGTIQAPSGNSDQGVYKTFPSAVTISANGSRANQTAFRMDGANNNDTYTNVNQPFPFPDALQEFSVQTSNYSSKYGGNSGGVVNVVTKSGTNELHGGVFEFVRNAEFNARNSFAAVRDQLKRNQFGGTVGGPIVIPHLYDGRNKTFFFFGYQGTRIRNVQNGLNAFVPTDANRTGDFSALLDANSPANPFGRVVAINDPVTGRPFAGNLIPTSRFDPAAQAFLKYLPPVGGNGLVYYSQPLAQNFNSFLSRVDHSFSDRDRITARYYLDRFKNASYLDQTNYVNVASGSIIDSHNALISETHIFKPTLLNDFRIGFARVESNGGPPDNSISVTDLGLNIYQPPFQKSLDGLSVAGYFNISDFPPSLFARNNYTLSDDVSWVRGRHTVSFGGGYERGQVMLRNGYLAYGTFGFTTDYTNNALASFLLGKMRTFRQGFGEFKDNRSDYFGLYAQDDFHVNRRLTLNFGVRYEPFLPQREIRGRIQQFRKENYYAGVRSQVYVNAPPGLLFPGDPGMPDYGVRGNYFNFAPRLGFAYDVGGDGKTSLRGGAGVFYDSQQVGIINNRFVDVTPFSPQITFTDPSGPFSNPYSGVTSPFPAPFPAPKDAPFPAPVLAVTYDPANDSRMATPVTYNWNISIERQINRDWMARLAYVGSRSVHQTETTELNPAVYTPGSALGTDARRLFQGFSTIGQGSQDLNSKYHSLQVTLQRRFSRGVTILANYTFSKSLDDVPNGQGVAGISSQSLSPIPWYFQGRHEFDYGRSDFDRRQRFVLSYVWELPRLQNASPALRAIAGGWQFNGIVTLQTGGPLTLLAGRDASLTGLGTDRAQYVSGSPYGGGACKNIAPCRDYLNTAAFGTPATGTFGNVGKGSLNGPNFRNWDLGLFKNIALRGERLSLRFQAEFFNATNRVNLSNPNQTQNAAAFGSIRGAGDPRIGQLALKLLF